MKHFRKIAALMIFVLIGILALTGSAYAKQLTVGTGTGAYGATVAIPITLDDPTGVGGVAFTLTYNADIFEFTGLEQAVKVIDDGSTYYDDGSSSYVVEEGEQETVSNTLFYQFNDEPLKDRVLVAGASARALTDTDLFKAKFLIKDGVPDGIYPIGLSRTIITNPAAGYDTATFIPGMVGMPADTANAQGYYDTPVFTPTLVSGSINVNNPATLFTISGAVTYQGGASAANGTPVVLKKSIGGVYVFQAQTTVNSGAYSFAGNAAGDYRVFVTSNDPNYFSNFAPVTVAAANATVDVVLPAPVRVSGIVTLNSGYLPGLRVKVMNGDQVVGIYAVNADGTYQSGPLAPGGTYTAYAVYGSLTSPLLDGSDNWDEDLYAISGTVLGLDTGATATVTAVSASGLLMISAVSDATDGSYTISDLVPAADYKVSAVAEGFPVLYYDSTTDITQADSVDISVGSNATVNFDFVSVTKGTLAGTVTEGVDPKIGIGVYAFNMQTPALVSVVTNDSGVYTLTLPPGSYELFVIKESGSVFYYDAESDGHVTQNEVKADLLTVTAGVPLTGKDMDIIECDISLAGRVTYERPDGNPVAFALITATSGDKKDSTITGLAGSYTLSGLCEGLAYTVEMDPQVGNYGIQTETITAGTDTTLNFIIDTGHVLSGNVQDSVSLAGIANAMIYLLDQDTQILVGGRMYFSASDGSYSIRDIPTGIYTLVVSHPLYRTYTETGLVIETDTSGKDIPLVQGAHFYGTVLDGSNANAPLGDVLIIVTRPGGTPVYAVTNSSGSYSVYGLDASQSDYLILAQKRGYVRQVKTFQQPATGAGTDASFTLAYPAALFDLSGVITSDCDGNPPVPGALVVVSSASEKFFSSTTTNALGAYNFSNLPQAADYRLVVVPGGSLQVHVETGLSYSATTEKDIILPCGSEISGMVTWTGTTPAYVLMYTAANEFVDFAVLDTSPGTYAFTGLAAGNYKLLAISAGNTPEWYNSQTGIGTATEVSAGATGIDIDLTQ